jgi:hypothetical protein
MSRLKGLLRLKNDSVFYLDSIRDFAMHNPKQRMQQNHIITLYNSRRDKTCSRFKWAVVGKATRYGLDGPGIESR